MSILSGEDHGEPTGYRNVSQLIEIYEEEFRMKIKKHILLMASMVYLSGCASGGGAFSSKVNSENIIPIKKVFFLTDAKNQYFNATLNAGFESSLRENLSSCGIDLSILQVDRLDLDFDKTLKNSMESYVPDAFLVMRSDGGNVVTTTGGGGDSGTLYFNLGMNNYATKKAIWVSRLGYNFLTNNMFSSDKDSGALLGDQLYNRLVVDKVIPDCTVKIKKSKKSKKAD